MIREIIAADKSLVTYRPALRSIGGSVTGTVLLQQIIYWDEKSGGKFFKFSEPCKHEWYKDGDSWEEELGMSAKELRTALNHFAFKCGAKNRRKFGDEYNEKRNGSLVQYYTDSHRVTWYLLNREVLSKLLLGIYKENDQAEVTLITETTPETTTDITNNVEANASPVENKASSIKSKKTAEQEEKKFRAAEFIALFNEATGRSFRVLNSKAQRQLNARLKEGYTMQEIANAAKNASLTDYFRQNPHYLTPEYITRADKLDLWMNAATKQGPDRNVHVFTL